MRVRLKTRSELEHMRESGRIVAEVLELMDRLIQPGATPRELDEAAEAHIRSKGAVPSFKGYHGYPASLCVSINEQIVHGIPDGRVLESGVGPHRPRVRPRPGGGRRSGPAQARIPQVQTAQRAVPSLAGEVPCGGCDTGPVQHAGRYRERRTSRGRGVGRLHPAPILALPGDLTQWGWGPHRGHVASFRSGKCNSTLDAI